MKTQWKHIEDNNENNEKQQGAISRVFSSAMQEWRRANTSGLVSKGDNFKASLSQRIERGMSVAITREIGRLERGMTFLASIGSVAPFIGLFGTVWGIMNSFQSLATNTQNALSIVAPGISEALVATALGLIAAIPAVLFYNKFIAQLDKLTSKYENFSEHLIKVLQKQYLIDKDAL